MQINASPAATQAMALRPDVVATVLDDGAVLLDLESKYFYALNGTGWAIVQLFESGACLDDVRTFAASSGAPDDGEVAAFVERCLSYDLFEFDENGAGAAARPPFAGSWIGPTIERQSEPLQKVVVSAFDPSIPLAE